MKGIPEDKELKQIKEDTLTIANNRIADIEYIDFHYFKTLLKDHHIKTDKYETYWNRAKPDEDLIN